MPGSILDRYVSIPYDLGTNPYRYAKSWIIAEPAQGLSIRANDVGKWILAGVIVV